MRNSKGHPGPSGKNGINFCAEKGNGRIYTCSQAALWVDIRGSMILHLDSDMGVYAPESYCPVFVFNAQKAHQKSETA